MADDWVIQTDEHGTRVLHVPSALRVWGQEPDDARIDVLLERLDALARKIDCYEFGLPFWEEEHKGKLRALVRDWLKGEA